MICFKFETTSTETQKPMAQIALHNYSFVLSASVIFFKKFQFWGCGVGSDQQKLLFSTCLAYFEARNDS